jgi:hypothetical protein
LASCCRAEQSISGSGRADGVDEMLRCFSLEEKASGTGEQCVVHVAEEKAVMLRALLGYADEKGKAA